MPAAFLDSEIEEMNIERSRLDLLSFNNWFDLGPIKKRFKKAAMQHQSLRCCYCQRLQLDHNNFLWDLEHILCESIYPQFFTETINLSVACKRCNNAKRQKDVLRKSVARPPSQVPLHQDYYSIPHPSLTDWYIHVRHTAYLIYEGLTPEGEALITCCELNGKAEEAAGITPGAIRTAITTNFFAKLGGQVASHINEHAVVTVTAAAVEVVEELQVEQALKRLKRSLGTYDREAKKRYQAILGLTTA